MADQKDHVSGPGRLPATLEYCWCNPQFRQACPECGEGFAGVAEVFPVASPRVAPIVECWRCDGHGLVEPYDDLEPKIVIHGEETDG